MNPNQLKEIREQFNFHLESLKNLTPASLAEMTHFINELGNIISSLVEKPDKTEEEFEHIQQMSRELQLFIGQLSEACISMRKQEWHETNEYYEKLKRRAEGGDETAQELLIDFEPVYREMKERMSTDEDIDFPSTQSSRLLASLAKL